MLCTPSAEPTGFPGHYATPVASEDQLLAAAVAAKPFAAAGEAVVGVLVADPFAHGLVFLCALGPPPSDDDEDDEDEIPELGWIAVDGDGLALADCAAGAGGGDARGALRDGRGGRARARRRRDRRGRRARARAGGDDRPELRAALEATREAALAAAAHGDGLRVARTGYVDELADAARGLGASAQALQQCGAELSAGLSGEALDPAEPLARAVWDVLEQIAAAGAPERFSDALGDAAPAISAFAEDVLAHYRAELDEGGARHELFEGRTALITGGGTGMGRAFALALAERGAPVAVCGRRAEPIEETAELCRAHGVAALASQVDVRDPERVERLGDRGGRGARAAAAARSTTPPATSSRTPSTSRRTAGAPSSTSSSTARSTARRRSRGSMREAGVGGAMLNVIATYAWTGNPMTAHSAAAKAGVWNLARSLAVEWAPLGIRVNCIAPGRSTARARQSASSRRRRSASRCSTTSRPAGSRRSTTWSRARSSCSPTRRAHHRGDPDGRRRAGRGAGHVPPQPDSPAADERRLGLGAGARERGARGRCPAASASRRWRTIRPTGRPGRRPSAARASRPRCTSHAGPSGSGGPRA